MKKIDEEYLGRYSVSIEDWSAGVSSWRTSICHSCVEGMNRSNWKTFEKKTVFIRLLGPRNDDLANIASSDRYEAIGKLKEISTALKTGELERAENEITNFFLKIK